jgi:hypothetical protein
MSIAEAIRNNQAALVAAAAKDWAAVAAILRAITVTADPRECSSVETADALIAVGANPFEDLDSLNHDATGQLLLSKLSSQGIAWAHRLTRPYLQGLVTAGKLSQVSLNALVQLSSNVTHPFADVTPEQCASAYLVGADVLLSINRTGGTLKASINVIREGQQVRLAMLAESQGSEADQTLTSSIESAIDTWLAAGV